MSLRPVMQRPATPVDTTSVHREAATSHRAASPAASAAVRPDRRTGGHRRTRRQPGSSAVAGEAASRPCATAAAAGRRLAAGERGRCRDRRRAPGEHCPGIHRGDHDHQQPAARSARYDPLGQAPGQRQPPPPSSDDSTISSPAAARCRRARAARAERRVRHFHLSRNSASAAAGGASTCRTTGARGGATVGVYDRHECRRWLAVVLDDISSRRRRCTVLLPRPG